MSEQENYGLIKDMDQTTHSEQMEYNGTYPRNEIMQLIL
jgi:hypothetical protein